MMATDDFEVWKIYWEVNLFHTMILCGAYKCILCKKNQVSNRTISSDFVPVVARCSANRDPRVFEGSSRIGVCPACEIDLVQNIAERKQVCFKDGCRRLMMAVECTIKQRLRQKEIVEK